MFMVDVCVMDVKCCQFVIFLKHDIIAEMVNVIPYNSVIFSFNSSSAIFCHM